MKTHTSPSRMRIAVNLYLPVVITLLFCSFRLSAQDGLNKYFMGIELNGTLCGYSEIYVSPPQTAGTPYLGIDQKTFISFRAIGRDISQRQVFTYRIDPASGNFTYHESNTESGEQRVGAVMTVTGDSVYIQPGGKAVTSVYLPEKTILPNTMFFPHLQADFGSGVLDSCTYRMLNVRTGKVEDFVYHKLGEEQIELNNTIYEAIILEERDPGTGLLTTYWIDRDSGLRLKMESRTGIRMYLSDISVMERLSTGSWDDLIFIRTNERIEDLRKISSMMVQADIDAFPGPGIEDLNVNGQSFKGTITGNSLEGSFEVNHQQYKGEEALSFHVQHSFSDNLKIYLQPEDLIQSEDTAIKNLALTLTEGAKDFWEATCRLSSWVAENIQGSIIGGSALETLQKGSGPCGSQSMLMAALCRASGIPSRIVWGCVYTPEYGGSFGHHGWNEIYVGSAGWIPVDVTLHETDYVDSGHVRLGILKTDATVINFREMTILKYR